jgi:hypothetical protein
MFLLVLWIRIPDPVLFDTWIQDPDPGIRDKHPGSYFRELSNIILGFKYINSLLWIRIRDPVLFHPGSGVPDPVPDTDSAQDPLLICKKFKNGKFLKTMISFSHRPCIFQGFSQIIYRTLRKLVILHENLRIRYAFNRLLC